MLFPAVRPDETTNFARVLIRTRVSPSCAPRMRSFAPVVTRTSGEKTTAAPAVSPIGTSDVASRSFDARAVRRGEGETVKEETTRALERRVGG